MGAIRYGETVTLLIPYEEPRTLSLADAVFTVLQSEDRIKRTGARIVRENGEEFDHGEMVRLYDRPDFPKRPRKGDAI